MLDVGHRALKLFKRRELAFSSKSQFVPTRKHTNLGCGSLQAKRCPDKALDLFTKKTKRYMPYHRNVIYNPGNIQLQKKN